MKEKEQFVGLEGLVNAALARSDDERRSSFRRMAVGQADLVHTPRGIGKVREVAGNEAEVTFFESPGQSQAAVVTYPLGDLRRAQLEPDRRCWVRRADQWWPGRVRSGNGWTYAVKFPGRLETVPAGMLFVRWDEQLSSPLPDIVARVTGAPAGLDARRAFLSAYFDQVAATRGLTGVTSIAAVLYDHQMEVARRVLDDPIGRFLLADEVGLGKTIEALMVVRQTLVDHPAASVRIICPAPLVEQWKGELSQRIFVRPGVADDFPFAQVDVVASTNASAWRSKPLPDVLVIDEAHQVASWAKSSDAAERRLWQSAVVLTRRVGRTLLLSATPSLHRDETYLALLHLLDPQKHDLTDLEGFRGLLAMRERVATSLAGLERDEDDPAFVTTDALVDMLEHLPGSAADLRSEARSLIDSITATDAVTPADAAELERLRAKVAERHRLDGRMLRTRRDRTRDRYPVRGRQAAEPVALDRPKARAVSQWLDQWRGAVFAEHGHSPIAARVVRIVYEHAWADPEALGTLVALRLRNSMPDDAIAMAGLDGAEAVLLEQMKAGPDERGELEAAPNVSGAREEYADVIAEWIWKEFDARDHLVVASSSTLMVGALVSSLQERLRPEEIGAVTSDRPASENAEDVARFIDPSRGGCHILLCDEAGEEGLNLQRADRLLLLDAPLDAGRVEQRIGRIDRHSQLGPVQVVPIVPATDHEGPWVWFDVLRDGFDVFNRSIAAFQVPVAEVTRDLEAVLYERGPAGLLATVADVRSKLEAAVREVRRSDLLDSSTVTPDGLALHEAVTTADTDDELQRSVGRFLDKSLRLFRRHHGDGLLSYWSSSPFPGREWHTEVDGSLRSKYLVDAISADGHVRISSFDRVEALQHPGTRVLRPGDRLVDAATNLAVQRFDVARTAAIWRKLTRTPEDRDWAIFGFHFIVGPGTAPPPPGWSSLEIGTAKRRVSMVLPTRMTSVWISADGLRLDPDSDEVFLAELPFDASDDGGDVALFGAALTSVEELLPGTWESALRSASEAATAAVALKQTSARASREAQEDAARRRGILSGRGDSDIEVLSREEALTVWVDSVVQAPEARLDAVSAVILSTRSAPAVSRLMPPPVVV